MNELDSLHTNSRMAWMVAGLVAVVLHAGGVAFALTKASGDDDGGGLGTAADVIDVEIAAPKVEDSDLPTGADSVADTASVATPEQKAETEQTDLQKGLPTTTEEADQRVSPTAVKKPTEEEKVATVETNASEAHDAAIDSSRRTLDAKVPEADRVKAPDPTGTGKDRDPQTTNWQRRLSLIVKKNQKYPPGKTQGGSVRVSFKLNRRGNVISVDVTQSSGDPDYDREAVAMVRRSDPFPKPPAKAADDEIPLSVVVNFPPGKA
ncbi:energy transducer TonB [Bradyrhizobium sp. SSBR45G]|uniref:energy transducer TonB family protein n=1 Tax=unclassified Bradyrhizobium TaxID=2631580 RepID=UPI002342A330|nr:MULTISPECIES: energy transducer TonB [unclassified Bradyrhizobium]GLH76219.1 energy transducer TonB [Bradyrhizobium sp. SSBR45G]GLH83297.1 energy transducer TonB [Bradyrhizobium sp. SSBR45R]